MVLSIFCAPTSISLIERPSLFAKIGWMALTLLPELKSANMGTDFLRKMMGYRMHRTCTSFSGYLLLLYLPSLPVPTVSTVLAVSTALAVSIVLIVSSVCSLVLVTGIEVAETDTSFLVFENTWWRNIFSSESCNTRLGRHLSLFS